MAWIIFILNGAAMNHDAESSPEFSRLVRPLSAASNDASLHVDASVATCAFEAAVYPPIAAPTDSALARLCEALDAAFHATAHASDPSSTGEFAHRIRAALTQAVLDPTLLSSTQREGASETYRRHLLAADPHGRYALVALVWQPGQASPVHAHQTWCGYAVIEGTLTETAYHWNETTDCAAETRMQLREAGAVSYTRAGTTGIHKLSNGSTTPAISLHLYGVGGTQIATHVNDLVRIEAPNAAVALAAP
jgi:predicted metal-dependent enzyme (double-stranded beta helix superfamily)